MKSRIINLTKTQLLGAPRLGLVATLLLVLALPLAALGQANYATPYTFTTLAGTAGNWGSADGTGSAAQFDFPYGVAVDTNRNVYVADTYNNTIRKVTPAGVVTTLAGGAGISGSADGTGSAARFYNPYGVAVDTGGTVYVVDSNNHTVRKVTPAGVVTTLAGLPGVGGSANGTGSAARFYYPDGLAVDTTGNVYVADTYNCTIRKVTPAGVVTTLAGLAGSSGSADGTGSAARFNYPYGVAVDTGGTLYVVDSNNNTIRRVTPAGVVTTLAGVAGLYGSADGTGSAARFDYPDSVAVDSGGNIYVADTYNNTIRKVTPAGVVTTLAGLVGSSGSADGTGSAAQFYSPHGVAVDIVGNVYVADTSNNTIRKGVFVPFVLQVTATPTNGTVPLTVQFTSASIDNAGNAITNWAWTFGDGSTSAVQNPSHTYTAAGTFHPGLTASNNLSSAVAASVPSVAASLPTVQVTANPSSGPLPLTVQFTSASVDSAGNAITNWAWTFGDGSTSALQNPSHTYTVVNYFYPSLTATNNIGVAVLSSVPFISTWLPTVQFTATPTVGGVPLVVQFTSPNTDSAGNAITHWNWTFGDGSSSTAQSPSHTYSSAGLFFPSLLVTNSNGTAISASGPAISAAAYSGLVLNGGFETGDFFGWTLNAAGGLYNLVDTFGQSTEGMQPHTGSYFARLGQTGSLGYLSQTLATTAGANYLLSFWLNSPDGQTPNQFLVSWNGTVLFSGINLPASGWTNLQFTVAATGSTTVLQFGFRDDPTAFGLDDISVIQLTPPLQVTLPPSATEGDGTLAGAGRVRIPAPLATNLTVVLSSSDTSQVTVPASAVILTGQTNALFDVTVVDDSVLDGTQMPTITAAAPGFVTGSATMAVFDNETASLHVLLPASATEGQGSVQGTVQISAPPGANVTVSLASSDLGLFQVPASVVLPAGQTSAVFTATVISEKLVGGDQTATVTAHVANWTDGAATITIHERVNHFQWSGISSPQFTNRPFAVTITAKDEFNLTVSSFTGTVTLSGSVPGGLRTNTLLPSPSFQASGSGGTYTVGNSFTPNTNITVTAVRHYFGTKVSIWTDTGTLLAAQNVTSVPGTWVETPLATPLQLLAGNTYRVTVLAPNVTFYWIYASSTPFPDGTVQQSYEGSGDVFPTFADVDLWLVDLKYTAAAPQPFPISPTVSANFTNGTWTGNVTVAQPVTNLTLLADDLAGHTGRANTFEVLVDTRPPAITCPSNVLVNTDPGQCSAVVNYSVTATDNCAVVSLTVNPPSGSLFPKGTNVVTCEAIDCGGNSNTCSFTVTVLDREPPAFTCPTNQTIVCLNSNGAPAFYAATATDNCGANLPVAFIPTSGSTFPPGTNTVQCLATDSSGNTNSCAFTVTVIVPAPDVAAPGSTPYGKSYADWSVAWWQWGLGLPTNGHPFTVSTNFDVTEGQTGRVWFLAMPDGTNARTCTIPDGKALFFALPDSEWSSLEGFATETDQRANAKLWGDHIVNPFCTIDGVPVQSIGSFRVGSPQFTFTAPTPWIYGDTGGAGTTVADGYYVFLDPLPVGQHTLHFGGGFHFAIAAGDTFDFDDTLDMTYHLTVQAPGVGDPGSTNYGKSYADWSVAWWQWGLGLPTNGHPFTVSPNFDVTEGQTGQVWFLAMPDGTNARICTIPDGKALFFALPDSEWSSLEGFATETDQRVNAKLWGDHIVNPFCTIDGVSVQNIGSFRIGSPQFNFTAPTPWIYGDTGGAGTTVADGYYIFLDPLPVGPHTLHFGGSFHFAVAEGDAFDFDDTLDMTYGLAVAPASVSLAQQGTNLTVSWPQTATTYVLEETDSLNPANWLPAGAPVQPVGTVYQVTIPIDKSSQFFRLRKHSP